MTSLTGLPASDKFYPPMGVGLCVQRCKLFFELAILFCISCYFFLILCNFSFIFLQFILIYFVNQEIIRIFVVQSNGIAKEKSETLERE